MNKIIFKYSFYDLIRSKVVIAYTLILFLITSGLIYFSKDPAKVTAAVLNVMLFLVPLTSIVFGTIHFYSSGKFIEFILSQPVNKKNIFFSSYFGLAVSLAGGFVAGSALPLLIFDLSQANLFLIFCSIILIFIFTGLAYYSSNICHDKVKGIGLAIFLWIFFSIIYDGITLILFYAFSNFPLQTAVIAAAGLNPLDLARIIVLIQLDISALMGFTGAVFQKFFGASAGIYYSLLLLTAWSVLPLMLAYKSFKKKNF